MKMLKSFVHALAFLAVLGSASASIVPQGDERFFFRYKGFTDAAYVPPEVDPDQFDVTARFLGVVGESFESVVPTKPGAVVTRWEIEDGSLPSGLGLDPASGAITGVPEESTAGRALAMRGLAPSGEMGTYASVRIDVLQARPEAYRQDLYAHTGKPFSKRLEAVAGATVYTWTPIVQFPEWASVDQGFVNAVLTEAGVWPFAYVGLDFAGNEVAFTYGSFIVEDGPVVDFIADSYGHRDTYRTIEGNVQRKVGTVRWELVGDLPPDMTFDGLSGVLRGRIDTFDTEIQFRLKAIDADGTTGLSNRFVVATWPADISIDALSRLEMVQGRPYSRRVIATDVDGEQSWSVVEGTLPPGLSFDATGRFHGTPAMIGFSKRMVAQHLQTASPRSGKIVDRP